MYMLSAPDEAWHWQKCVLHSGWLYTTSRPILLREMWFVDCSYINVYIHYTVSRPEPQCCFRFRTHGSRRYKLDIIPLCVFQPHSFTWSAALPLREGLTYGWLVYLILRHLYELNSSVSKHFQCGITIKLHYQIMSSLCLELPLKQYFISVLQTKTKIASKLKV